MMVGGNWKRANSQFRCHDMRHEFAIRWLEADGDIYDLAQHLGHSSVKVTERYLVYTVNGGAQKAAQRRRFSKIEGEYNVG